MTTYTIIPTQYRGEKCNIEIYQFASAFYTRVVNPENIVLLDNIGQSSGTYQEALSFGFKYQSNKDI